MPRKGFKFPTEDQARPRNIKQKHVGARGAAEKAGATCGAKKRNGGKCSMAAGWGTPHPGLGKCKLHGGSVPNHVKAAASEEHRLLLGTPRAISPEDALLECIQIRSGEVKWLGDRMAELDKKDWVEDTIAGKQFHLYARERKAALGDVARYSHMAISLNIETRKVAFAEQYGELLANLLSRILHDLMPHLDSDGKAKAPQIVRTHLVAIQGGQELKELPAA